VAIKVVLNRKEVRRLLRGEGTYSGVASDLDRRARAIAAAAGDGMEADSGTGPNRARASVRTVTREAMEAEATDRALTRAVDAGR
jgi:hypothetical protein